MSMDIRTLGDSAVPVSPIGLGLAALGRPGYINVGHQEDIGEQYTIETMEARAHAMLTQAHDLGIRYIDAARSYGRAEAFLGSWLRNNPDKAEDFTIGSKWGYKYTANWTVDAQTHEVKEHSLDRLEKQWYESLHHLDDHLHVYQIHSATLESGVLNNDEVLDELARLRAKENILVGLSVSGKNQPKVIEKALEVKRDGVLLFGSVQATFNLLEPSAGPILKEARQQGMGVIVKEALANGRLTARNSAPGFAEKLMMLQAQANLNNTTLDAMAIAWVAAHPFVDVILSGAAKPEHLDSNVVALNNSLTDSTQSTLSVLKESPVAYWTYRSSLIWN